MTKKVLYNWSLFDVLNELDEENVIIRKGETTMTVKRKDCLGLLEKTDVSKDVIDDVMNYFSDNEYLSSYKVISITRASEHPDDGYLYHVLARRGDTYSCWTCWNQSTKSLNYGHYNLETKEDAINILNEYYHRLF